MYICDYRVITASDITGNLTDTNHKADLLSYPMPNTLNLLGLQSELLIPVLVTLVNQVGHGKNNKLQLDVGTCDKRYLRYTDNAGRWCTT